MARFDLFLPQSPPRPRRLPLALYLKTACPNSFQERPFEYFTVGRGDMSEEEKEKKEVRDNDETRTKNEYGRLCAPRELFQRQRRRKVSGQREGRKIGGTKL